MSNAATDDFVINPLTMKLIKKGGRVFRKLVKDELINEDGSELVEPEISIEEIQDTEKKIKEDEATSKIKDVSKQGSESSLEILEKIQNGEIDLPEMNLTEAREYLQRLIFENMIKKKKKFKKNKNMDSEVGPYYKLESEDESEDE